MSSTFKGGAAAETLRSVRSALEEGSTFMTVIADKKVAEKLPAELEELDQKLASLLSALDGRQQEVAVITAMQAERMRAVIAMLVLQIGTISDTPEMGLMSFAANAVKGLPEYFSIKAIELTRLGFIGDLRAIERALSAGLASSSFG